MKKNWCDSCKKHIIPIKIFNRRAFFILLLITFIGGIIYLIYFMVSRGDTCPICKQKYYVRYRKPKEVVTVYPPKPSLSQKNSQLGAGFKFCPYCGSKLPPLGEKCGQCGNKI